jgi:hypothetical protein
MRVLLVAPRTDLLLVDEEVQGVLRSGLIVTPLIGNVTSAKLLEEITSGSYDVLWFASHGDATGVLLSDGILSASELVPQVRERFKLVVLNTCQSLNVAQQLQEEANVDVICTILDVPDRQAYQTGSLLATALFKSHNVSAAYQRSKPGGNRLYLYLAALLPTEALIAPLMAEIRDLRELVSQSRKSQWRNLLITVSLHIAQASALIYVLVTRSG